MVMFRCGEVGDWKKLKVFILDEIYNNGVEEQFAMVNAGGQAVIEGVLMRYEDRVAVAVRNPEGKIVVKKERVRWKESKLPFVRGIVNLISMLRLGVAALGFSSDVALGIKKQKKGSAALVGSFIVAIIVGIFLFKFLPLGAAELVDGALGVSSFWFNVVDGGVRFLILVAYLGAVSLMADMRRVFEYHGAEHKAVNCFEAGKMLTVKKIGWTYSFMNLINPFFSGIPTCHGAGGIAGHYAFGGRSGGSVVIYGALFIAIGLFFSGSFTEFVHFFPMPILGVILLFEAFLLMSFIKDVAPSKKCLFVALIVALIAFNLPYGYAVALITGVILDFSVKKDKILKHF